MLRQWYRRVRGDKRAAVAEASAPPEPTPSEKPPAAPEPAPEANAAPSPDDLANPVIERFAEDENLRGDLTDDGYLPLQNWAIARIQRVAHEAAHHPDPEATMERFADQIRTFVRDAVQAAQAGALGDLPTQVQPRVVLKKDVPAVVDALKTIEFTSDADANTQAIAAALPAAHSEEKSA